MIELYDASQVFWPVLYSHKHAALLEMDDAGFAVGFQAGFLDGVV